MSRVLSQYDYGASVCLLRPVTRASVPASIHALRCRRPGGPGSGAAIVLGESITRGCACVSHRWAGARASRCREHAGGESNAWGERARLLSTACSCIRSRFCYIQPTADLLRVGVRVVFVPATMRPATFVLRPPTTYCLWTYCVLHAENILAAQGRTTAEHLPLPFTWRYYLEHVFGHPQKLCGTLGNPWHPLNTF